MTAFRITGTMRNQTGEPRLFCAEVDVETGRLWWRKNKTRRVYASYPTFTWTYLDTGEPVKWTN
jgi:hypothetical protein